MSGTPGPTGSKSQKSLVGFGFSVATSSKRKQKSSDTHLESDLEIMADEGSPEQGGLQPLSGPGLLKFTDPYPFAIYEGVSIDAKGKHYRVFKCSVCNDGFPHKCMYPNEASRHANVSKTHKDALARSRMAKSMRQSQKKMQQADVEAMLTASGKILSIASYMVAENIAWAQFPKVLVLLLTFINICILF
jgi:hypothetical protein